MPLIKIADFNPNYRQEAFDGEDVKGLDVYAPKTAEKIGTIHDVLVDEQGRFRYFVIDTGFWIFGKQVLLPVGRCRVDAIAKRIYATGIATKEQAEKLPQYDESITVDYAYEEQVRYVYRNPTAEESLALDTYPTQKTEQVPIPPRNSPPAPAIPEQTATYSTNNYTYEHEPALYQMNEQDHQKLRLYEERLIANKSIHKTGEVAIGKRIETQTTRVSVPVEKERVVIERTTPKNTGNVVTPGEIDFREGEVMHLNIYEETADISKQAFVREEVSIRKEVEHNTVDVTENLRREELEVDVEGKNFKGS